MVSVSSVSRWSWLCLSQFSAQLAKEEVAMDDLLFRILAVAATAGFLIGILCGWWPFFLVSILLAGLFTWLTRKPV